MKRLVVLLTILLLIPMSLFGWAWAARDATRQSSENPTIYLGDYLDVSYDVNADGWGADNKEIGWGTTNSAASLSWTSLTWVDEAGDGSGNNEGVKVQVQGTTTGTWYYSLWLGWNDGGGDDDGAGGGNGRYYTGSDSWNDGADSYQSSTVTVSSLTDPSDTDASASSSSQIDLTWTKWNSKGVMVVRNTSGSFTTPTNGTAYSASDNIGSDVVVYNGSGSSYNDTGLDENTTYYYKFYSVNNDYYSSGATDNDTSLPVELSDFSAYSSSKGVKLTWTTDSEIENHGFIIMRKSADKDWADIASFTKEPGLEGQGSTTNATDYYFVDYMVKDGLTYSYQLVDVDYQGKKTYHKDHVQTITYVNPGSDGKPSALKAVKLYPNPFNPTVTLNYDLEEINDLNVSIYNLAGEQVWNFAKSNHPAGANYTLLWNGNDLSNSPVPSGIYLVNIQAGGQTLSQKVTLLR